MNILKTIRIATLVFGATAISASDNLPEQHQVTVVFETNQRTHEIQIDKLLQDLQHKNVSKRRAAAKKLYQIMNTSFGVLYLFDEKTHKLLQTILDNDEEDPQVRYWIAKLLIKELIGPMSWELTALEEKDRSATIASVQTAQAYLIRAIEYLHHQTISNENTQAIKRHTLTTDNPLPHQITSHLAQMAQTTQDHRLAKDIIHLLGISKEEIIAINTMDKLLHEQPTKPAISLRSLAICRNMVYGEHKNAVKAKKTILAAQKHSHPFIRQSAKMLLEDDALVRNNIKWVIFRIANRALFDETNTDAYQTVSFFVELLENPNIEMNDKAFARGALKLLDLPQDLESLQNQKDKLEDEFLVGIGVYSTHEFLQKA